LQRGSSALRIRGAEEREQGQEEVDDVEVERDGGPHVLVVGVALDEAVGVVDDVAAEDERAVDHERDAAQREEELDHGEDDEDHDGGEEEGPEEAEVVPAPRRPERVRRQDRRLQDDRAPREGAGQAHREADCHGEEAEEQEVARVVVVQRAQHCNNK
jgi:hypothetical protein